jgi:FMN phosphatase YigB (HAD superfamily)
MTSPNTIMFDLGGVLIDRNPSCHSRDVVVSGAITAKKPDRVIYEALLQRNGLRAGDCLFIDDAEKNVIGARAVGLHAVRFTSPEALRADLRSHGFLAS